MIRAGDLREQTLRAASADQHHLIQVKITLCRLFGNQILELETDLEDSEYPSQDIKARDKER
jgi:hypothetical protein